MMQQWCMMIPLFHLDINIKLLALPTLSVLFQIRYTRKHEGSQGHLFRDISLLLERTLRVAKRSSVQLQESFCSCIMLYHSPGKHDIPPENECQLPNLPTTLEGVVSSQFPGRYISFWFVNCTTTLHSTFHWPQPCWKLLMYPGKGPMWNVRSSWEYSPSEVAIYGVQVKYINKNLQYRVSPSPLPSNTWNVWPFEKASHSDKTMHVKGHLSTSGWYSRLPGDLHRFRHPFLLLAQLQPATKLSQGNDVVALSTSKRTPKEI